MNLERAVANALVFSTALAGCNVLLNISDLPGLPGDGGSGSAASAGSSGLGASGSAFSGAGQGAGTSTGASAGAAAAGAAAGATAGSAMGSAGIASGASAGSGAAGARTGASSGAGTGASTGATGTSSGSTSGTSTGAASGASGSSIACTEGLHRCMSTVPQTCTGGTWMSAPGCSGSTPECLNGGCVTCIANEKRCLGNTVQTCQGAAWAVTSTCAANEACVNNACIPMFASCKPGGNGMTNCGASSESCCTSIEVPGGMFYRTYDVNTLGQYVRAADGGPTNEADPATLSGFRLDKYEVTVGRFRQFVAAWRGGWLPPLGSGKHAHLNGGKGLVGLGGYYEPGWGFDASTVDPTDSNLACDGSATWTPSPGGNEKLPINCVFLPEAQAFCIWDGGFLPSDAEWEYTAAGGNEQRQYPWGATLFGDAREAIYSCYYGPTGCPSVANIAPVGSAPLGAGLWGHMDLAGNVFEMNVDVPGNKYFNPCNDCFSQSGQLPDNTIRGGSFDDPSIYDLLAETNNHVFFPITRKYTVGFRCARTP